MYFFKESLNKKKAGKRKRREGALLQPPGMRRKELPALWELPEGDTESEEEEECLGLPVCRLAR